MDAILIKVKVCADNSNLFKCPRCWKWHPNKWNTNYQPDKPDNHTGRHKFCDSCEKVLIDLALNGGNHEASLLCLENAKRLGRI